MELDQVPGDTGVKSDSEAETIVLPGKDGHSPSKIRKSIKHEDKSEMEDGKLDAEREYDGLMDGLPPMVNGGSRSNGSGAGGAGQNGSSSGRKASHGGSESEPATSSSLGKRKRPKHGITSTSTKKDYDHHDNDYSIHDNASSSLSIPSPSSPIANARLSSSRSASESEDSRSPSPPLKSRDKAKSVDHIVSRRKLSGSSDEGEIGRFEIQRSSGVELKESRDRASNKIEVNSCKRTRSISPPARNHRRSLSTQTHSKSSRGLSHKKKRIPSPLQSADYRSDESSTSDKSHRRRSRLRHLAAPATSDSAISPAKMAPHKKNVNSSGQTQFARACATGKLDKVKQALEARPDDLNEGDYAQNTPLHTASLMGHVAVVEFLLKAGCAVDPVNAARDTPLHDAIDNSHLDVVILLLDAGANPRKANGKGEDPYDLVEEETDVTDELHEAILAAKARTNDRRSEDEQMLDESKDSPHDTPPTRDSGHTSRRNPSTRAIKTSDSTLYQSFNLSELRKAAGQNDSNTVVRIIEVHNNNIDDPKSLIIAAKAGNHDVINMLLGYGGFNPDPDPLDNQPPESSTPVLAAIGRDNLEVIKLFINQPDFDPTRRVKGETYFEIAKRRGGSIWKDEESLLREAYDKYKKSHKSSPNKPRSPGMRRDGRDADAKRTARRDEQQPARSHNRRLSSQMNKDSEGNRNVDQNTAKRGPGRPRKEDHPSGGGITPLGPPKQKPPRKSEADHAASDSEVAVKPRRKKLVSGKEFRGDRSTAKPRRASITSNASSVSTKDRREGEGDPDKTSRHTSPSIPRVLKPSVKELSCGESSVKLGPDKDRHRSLKRDESKDRISAIRGESPVKRPRKSETPPRLGTQEVTSNYSTSGGQSKRRKIGTDSRTGTKTETLAGPSSVERKSFTKTSPRQVSTSTDPESKNMEKSVRTQRRVEPPERSRTLEKKQEKPSGDTAMWSSQSKEERDLPKRKDTEHPVPKDCLGKEGLSVEDRAIKEADSEREKAEVARQEQKAQEQAACEEESRRHKEETERREKQRQEEAGALAREQKRLKEQRLEQERQKREEQERRRMQLLEQQRAERILAEQERLNKLPPLLRMFDSMYDHTSPEFAKLFRHIDGFRYDTIKEDATGQPNGREEWMLNTHAALLLGEKDLQLSRYTAWERISLSDNCKESIWRTDNGTFTLEHPALQELALVQRYRVAGPEWEIANQCKPLFLGLDIFFVKVSEFMYVVPNFAHLRGLELVVRYREISSGWSPEEGWRSDSPTAEFRPQHKYYINGDLIRQGEVPMSEISTEPFGEERLPTRFGLGITPVLPNDPEFPAYARAQGLSHLLKKYNQQSFQANHEATNGSHHSYNYLHRSNGFTPPGSEKSRSTNGESPALPNGIIPHHIATMVERP
ncbi:hypothetical protein BJ878DRAFT_417062 [Calycina marina]|uniref:Uncharacterized protein n=1 Tax=Calycina marina TaxID=1763456 RepID=A0A9P7Z7N1_9HELO|nr:hypothetical protein BJ878DRAFT_417062 [Calycina marina]